MRKMQRVDSPFHVVGPAQGKPIEIMPELIH
jgi:hypothetical protein